MRLLSAPLDPVMDLVTRSADLNASHCLATYSKVRSSLSNCASKLAVLALSGGMWLAASQRACRVRNVLYPFIEPGRVFLQTLEVPKKHFDRALAQ